MTDQRSRSEFVRRRIEDFTEHLQFGDSEAVAMKITLEDIAHPLMHFGVCLSEYVGGEDEVWRSFRDSIGVMDAIRQHNAQVRRRKHSRPRFTIVVPNGKT